MIIDLLIFINNSTKVITFVDENEKLRPFRTHLNDISDAKDILSKKCLIDDALCEEHPFYIHKNGIPVFLAITDMQTPFLPDGYKEIKIIDTGQALSSSSLSHIYLAALKNKNLDRLFKLKNFQNQGYPCSCLAGDMQCTVYLENGIFADKCLVDEIKKLNESGFQTVSSCCGHELTNGSITLKNPADELVDRWNYTSIGKNSVIPKSKMPKSDYTVKLQGGLD